MMSEFIITQLKGFAFICFVIYLIMMIWLLIKEFIKWIIKYIKEHKTEWITISELNERGKALSIPMPECKPPKAPKLSVEEINAIRDTLCLMNSMILFGEKHSEYGEKMFKETLELLERY